MVPVSNGKGFEKFYLHDGVSWTPLNSYALGLLCHKHNPYTISSNGILYVADKYMLAGKIVLCAFDTTKHNAPCLCQIKLPEFENLELENNEQIPVFMVAVADYTLCFLWHMICGDQQSPLYYAKVSITLKPASATLVKEAAIDINAIGVSSCLPFSMPQGTHQGSLQEFPAFESKKPMNLEELGALKILCTSLNNRVNDLERRPRKSSKHVKKNKRRIKHIKEEELPGI